MVKSLSAPVGEVEKPEIKALISTARARLEAAIKEKGKDPKDYDFIDLMPSDLGLTNDEWKHTYSNAYTYESLVNKTLDDDVFVAIYAIYNRSGTPVTTKVRFWRGSIPIKEFYLEDMYVEDVPKKYIDPEVWSEGEVIKIEGYATSATEDRVGFAGIKAVSKGKVLGSTE